mgnify:CR=1 FL=1
MRRELSEAASLLAFLVGTALLFRSWEFALIVTASLGFHELGHAVALRWFGLAYRVHFGMVGAWTWTRGEERAGLSQLANVYIHLAGPLFSLGLSLIALALNAWWQPGSPHLELLANFSAQTGFLNLLPLGTLTDGGKVLRRMANSARDGSARRSFLLFSGAVFIFPGLWVLAAFWQAGAEVSNQVWGLVLIGAWLAAGALAELYRAHGVELAARRPMNAVQIVFTTLLVWDMLAVLLAVILFTPFWLAPQYVRGALQNMTLLLGWLFSLL